jgi:hypothetical protein
VGENVTTWHGSPPECIGERWTFMQALMHWGGVADRNNLGPQTSQEENAARQFCKRRGWVVFEGGYWRITDAGCAAFGWERPKC